MERIGSLHRTDVPFRPALRRVAPAALGTLAVGLSDRVTASRLRLLCRHRRMGHPAMVAHDLRADRRLWRDLLDHCLATKDTGNAGPRYRGILQTRHLLQRTPVGRSDRPTSLSTIGLSANVHHDRMDAHRPLRKIAQRIRKA